MTDSLWRHRNFLVLWSGKTLSEVGDAVSMLVIPLLAVTVLDASAVEVGVLSATRMVAYLFLSLPAGVWVDRMRKRRVMVVCHLVRAGLVATVAVGAWAGWVTMMQLWTVALLSSVCTVLYETAHQSFLPSIVTKDQLLDANGKLTTTYSVSRIAGYGVGGAVVSALGVARAAGVDALAYVVNAASLLLIRDTEERPTVARRRDFRRELGDGLSFVFRHPVMPRLVAAAASFNLFSQMLFALAVLYLVRDLRLSEGMVGVVMGLTTVGGIVGGLASARLARVVGTARIIWIAPLGIGWTVLLVPAAQSGWGPAAYTVGMAGMGVVFAIFNSASVSYRQRVCPPELLGRMTASVRFVIFGVMPVGALAGGLLGSWLGVRPTLWIAAVGVWASGLLLYFSPLRRWRDLPDEADAPAGGQPETRFPAPRERSPVDPAGKAIGGVRRA
ncbi:MFS transporter [Micromonospora parathelypteridis]|uniref:MFS family permease n=1 Tax=Micromonospora parathelypteridis TaxID=1839617 RepID=A0A840VZY9_9ACTN|nr:MFS transporter [Micromonospora parathelypteridis]MBB5481546.1 MFS family permease [Micromonospora parathelypteridis]GGO29353.1 MFS transporter [Micromonospora parathelypteridis]